MAAVLSDAQRDGALRPELDTTDLAASLVAVVQGGYVLARATQDPTQMERATRGALALLDVATTNKTRGIDRCPRGRRRRGRKGIHDGDSGTRQRQGRYLMTTDHPDSAGASAREHLLTGAFDAHIDRVEAHRIALRPGRKSGRHAHPGGVVGYMEDGEVAFEIDGRPATTLRRGDVFYEPPGAAIARFDNASDTATATFIAFYPLTGDQALISMLD